VRLLRVHNSRRWMHCGTDLVDDLDTTGALDAVPGQWQLAAVGLVPAIGSYARICVPAQINLIRAMCLLIEDHRDAGLPGRRHHPRHRRDDVAAARGFQRKSLVDRPTINSMSAALRFRADPLRGGHCGPPARRPAVRQDAQQPICSEADHEPADRAKVAAV
jgi:hypothetical protein